MKKDIGGIHAEQKQLPRAKASLEKSPLCYPLRSQSHSDPFPKQVSHHTWEKGKKKMTQLRVISRWMAAHQDQDPNAFQGGGYNVTLLARD